MIISTIEIKSCMLLKAEKLFCNKFFNGLVGEKHRKLIQFATLFHTWLHFVFQGSNSSVIWQISNVWTPCSIGVHYITHKTSLAIQTLLHLQMVIKLEGLFYTLYKYFSNNFKRHLEFTKLAKLMETKSAKILKNENSLDFYVVTCLMCYGRI